MFRVCALVPLFLAVACNFGTNLGAADAGVPDAGPQVITCGGDGDAECPQEVPVCSFGVCKRPCAANDGCVDGATFCNASSGFCEAGCRDSSTCADGQVCSGGTCIVSQGCATKCDCAVGEVCVGGACQDPPATCASPDDCGKASDAECEDFACNGFSHQCFDPDPTPCTADGDCLGRPGCGGGCTCVTDTGTCSTNVQCTVTNEATTCGPGFYCGGGTCQAEPGCTQESDCTSLGLTCNGTTCERSTTCSTSADCTAAPNTFCVTATGHCGQPLCNNGGTTCGTGQTCAPDGRCVTQGNGAPCTSDAQCQSTEYCALVGGSGQCAVGCRSNADCGTQSCDGTHTCVGGGAGAGGFHATCTGDGDCQAGLFCGGATHTCQESCTGSDCSVDGCCQLSGQPCCSTFIVSFCSSTGC